MAREMLNSTGNRRRWIRTFPVADQAFAEHVRALVGRLRSREPRDLEGALRNQYPEAVVHPSELSAQPTSSWYVYRDGHWSPPDP